MLPIADDIYPRRMDAGKRFKTRIIYNSNRSRVCVCDSDERKIRVDVTATVATPSSTLSARMSTVTPGYDAARTCCGFVGYGRSHGGSG